MRELYSTAHEVEEIAVIPTDHELNRAIGEAIGLDLRDDITPKGRCAVIVERVGEKGWRIIGGWNPCADRNHLPELWKAVCLCFRAYLEHLTELSCGIYAPGYAEREPYAWCEDTMTMSPRLHVMAALMALDKWPEGWEVK